jgi:polyisoprenoid-binding protein YceI
VAASIVGYDYVKPAAAVSEPLQALAIDSPTTTAADAATTQRYEIAAGTSQARFVIDEVLSGAPFTVVGSTDQVAGQIALDPTDTESAQIGTMLINARTLATDSTQRDRAIQNRVLNTEEHEYVSFTPTELMGLPSSLNQGETYAFQIVGDLTIRGVAQPVTFDATLTPASSERLEGSAITTIRYADWGISIPQVPMVASVSDDMQLYLDFVATAA